MGRGGGRWVNRKVMGLAKRQKGDPLSWEYFQIQNSQEAFEWEAGVLEAAFQYNPKKSYTVLGLLKSIGLEGYNSA